MHQFWSIILLFSCYFNNFLPLPESSRNKSPKKSPAPLVTFHLAIFRSIGIRPDGFQSFTESNIQIPDPVGARIARPRPGCDFASVFLLLQNRTAGHDKSCPYAVLGKPHAIKFCREATFPWGKVARRSRDE
jgi:hypothetical protein